MVHVGICEILQKSTLIVLRTYPIFNNTATNYPHFYFLKTHCMMNVFEDMCFFFFHPTPFVIIRLLVYTRRFNNNRTQAVGNSDFVTGKFSQQCLEEAVTLSHYEYINSYQTIILRYLPTFNTSAERELIMSDVIYLPMSCEDQSLNKRKIEFELNRIPCYIHKHNILYGYNTETVKY